MLPKGTLIDNRFEILSALGQGGFGEVYVARQLQLERKVALKLLKMELANDGVVARFEREAQILAQLHHPNIAMFIAFGGWADCRYTALEFVEGESLDRYLRRSGSVSSTNTVQIARKLLDALEHAHRHGVVHRDIKPANVMVSGDFGTIKLIDFGLAHIFATQQLTQEGLAVGSVQYMSPEQCSGNPVDARSDLYSVGCILYECLTGEPAFVADDAVGVMFLQMNESRKLFAKGNDGIAMFVNKLLEKNPGDRFQTAGEALAALSSLRVNDRVQPLGMHQQIPSLKRKRGALVALVALAFACGIAGGGIYWSSKQAKKITTFDFGPRILVTDQPVSNDRLRVICEQKLKAVDEAVRTLDTVDAASLPVLHTQIDSELRDVWEVTRRNDALQPQYLRAITRETLLPWRDDDFRYQGVHFIGRLSISEPHFEECALEALRIMKDRNDERDCDDRMGLLERLARLKIRERDYHSAHRFVLEMLDVFKSGRDLDTTLWKEERRHLEDAAEAMVDIPELQEDRQKVLRAAATLQVTD